MLFSSWPRQRSRRFRGGWAALLLLVAITWPGAAVKALAAAPFVPGEVLVGWQPGAGPLPAGQPSTALAEDRADPSWQQAARILAAHTGLTVLEAHPAHGAARLAVVPGHEEAEAARLATLPWVRYAEPNYLATAAGPWDPPAYPNDPFFADQWHMRRIGAPEAWTLTRGSVSFVVAVLDSGVERTHPEFANRLYTGYDYVNQDTDPNDDFGHGTHVTGILAAVMGNNQGVAGLAPDVKILPLKVLDRNGSGAYDDIATAIEQAVDFGAQIINLSLGGLAESERLRGAINYALGANPMGRAALVVAAAGNCAQGGQLCDHRTNPDIYPAAYPGVLVVAASDRFDYWAQYSGYKPYVGLAAPGGISQDRIWSTAPGGYDFKHGTSMATPLVSAAAALVWTMQPGATYQQVADILKNTADKVGVAPDTGQPFPYVDGRNDFFGYGRLNVGKAVRWAYPPALAPVSTDQEFLLGGAVSQQTRYVTVKNPSDQAVWWQATIIAGAAWLTASPASGTTSYAQPNTLALQANVSALPSGVYTGTVRLQSLYPAGLPGFDIPVRVQVSGTLRRSFVPGLRRAWPAASWLDPVTGGQALNLTNDTTRALALPFPVPFFGATYTTLSVSDNGLVLLGQAAGGPLPPPSECLKTAAAPNNAIYVLGLDWRPELGGQIYAHQPDTNTYALTWYNVRRVGGVEPQSFQLVFRRTGEIAAFYQAVSPAMPAIIGAENWDGTVAHQVLCGSVGQPVVSGDIIRFQTGLPW